MQHLTFSGYLKLDVYKDLQVAFQQKNFERACYLTAELACSRGEIQPLLDYLVTDVLTRRVASSDAGCAWLLQHVVDRLKLVRAMPKRGIHTNPGFQKALCEVLLALSTSWMPPPPTLAASGRANPQQTPPLFHEAIEPLLYAYPTIDAPWLHELFDHKVTSNILQLLKILFWMIVKKKTAAAVDVACYMLHSNEAGVNELVVDEISAEVRKSSRKDIVWYIWQTLLTFCQVKSGLSPDVKTYVRNALTLYVFQYKKRSRISRSELLYSALRVLCARKVGERGPPATTSGAVQYEEWMKRAGSSIGIVYNEVLGVAGTAAAAVLSQSQSQQQQNSQQQGTTGASAKAGKEPTQPKRETALNYLMTVPLRNDSLIEQVQRERHSSATVNGIATRIIQC